MSFPFQKPVAASHSSMTSRPQELAEELPVSSWFYVLAKLEVEGGWLREGALALYPPSAPHFSKQALIGVK